MIARGVAERLLVGADSAYVNLPATRKMLHVGNAKFPFNPSECEMNLLADFMVPAPDNISVYFILHNYTVELYTNIVRSR